MASLNDLPEELLAQIITLIADLDGLHKHLFNLAATSQRFRRLCGPQVYHTFQRGGRAIRDRQLPNFLYALLRRPNLASIVKCITIAAAADSNSTTHRYSQQTNHCLVTELRNGNNIFADRIIIECWLEGFDNHKEWAPLMFLLALSSESLTELSLGTPLYEIFPRFLALNLPKLMPNRPALFPELKTLTVTAPGSAKIILSAGCPQLHTLCIVEQSDWVVTTPNLECIYGERSDATSTWPSITTLSIKNLHWDNPDYQTDILPRLPNLRSFSMAVAIDDFPNFEMPCVSNTQLHSSTFESLQLRIPGRVKTLTRLIGKPPRDFLGLKNLEIGFGLFETWYTGDEFEPMQITNVDDVDMVISPNITHLTISNVDHVHGKILMEVFVRVLEKAPRLEHITLLSEESRMEGFEDAHSELLAARGVTLSEGILPWWQGSIDEPSTDEDNYSEDE